MKYPKINSLWKRELHGDRSLIEGDYACEEFGNIINWVVTEKIDGMNIRIHAIKDLFEWTIKFYGRTDDAMLPPKLLEYLQGHFTVELFENTFYESNEVILYGEGYGAKIQNGGYYSPEQRFVLFDVLVDTWWLEYDKVEEIAEELKIFCINPLENPESTSYFWNEKQIIDYVRSNPISGVAIEDHVIEGVVARAYPMMLTRDGTPIKFKLKCKDFK